MGTSSSWYITYRQELKDELWGLNDCAAFHILLLYSALDPRCAIPMRWWRASYHDQVAPILVDSGQTLVARCLNFTRCWFPSKSLILPGIQCHAINVVGTVSLRTFEKLSDIPTGVQHKFLLHAFSLTDISYTTKSGWFLHGLVLLKAPLKADSLPC